MKENTKMTASEFIKEFLDFVESARSNYQFNLDAMKNEENITQDYLHKLELEGLNYHERGKIATNLAANRRARRDYKDAVEELQPVVDFFAEPQHKKLINQMHQLLGQVRKIESYHQRRFYIPRVISHEHSKSGDAPQNLSEVS